MKFSCNQQILAKAFNTVSKAVTSKTTIPILKGILLQATEDGKLILSASDLDLSIEKIVLDVSVEEKGSIVVFSKLFGDIIRKLPNEEITIHQQQEYNISIKTSMSEFTIVGLGAEEFPNIGEFEDSESITIDKEIFREMIRKTFFSASIDETKGILTGVLIEIDQKNIRMVALDGFRLAIVEQEMVSGKNQRIIVSAKILNELYKIISETEEDETISLSINNKKAMILLENVKIILRLLDGEFIKYRDVLPKESKCKIKAPKKDLHESIERASLLSKEGKNNLIKIKTSEKSLIITSRSDEGTVREEVCIQREGDDLEIGFNSKYLLDVLKVVDDDEISMEMNTSVKPCLIKPVEGNNFEYLILPVRI